MKTPTKASTKSTIHSAATPQGVRQSALHKARKRFGQNFLVDNGIIDQIIRSIHPQADDTLVEIGPGQGAITEHLLNHCPHLNVIELDRNLVPLLAQKFSSYRQLQIHQADALKFDFSSLATKGELLRVVGNLPYNISTPLIFHLLKVAHLISDMHFMLQKEVVERMAAQPGVKAYGRLSIMVQYHCQVENLFPVPPESFEPQPKVESAIVRLRPYEQAPFVAHNIELFARLVNTAFQQRRKTIRNALKQIVSPQTIEGLGLDITMRPENISVREFVELSNAIDQNP